jgi:hypothetical protein
VTDNNDALTPLASIFGIPERTLILLDEAYPQFRFGRFAHGWHGARWVITRKDSSKPGLYCIVTDDLAEVQAALILDEVQNGRNQLQSRRAALWESIL